VGAAAPRVPRGYVPDFHCTQSVCSTTALITAVLQDQIPSMTLAAFARLPPAAEFVSAILCRHLDNTNSSAVLLPCRVELLSRILKPYIVACYCTGPTGLPGCSIIIRCHLPGSYRPIMYLI